MSNLKDTIQTIDIVCKWLFNMVRYYYITALVILFLRALIGASGNVELNVVVDYILWAMIIFKIMIVLKPKLRKPVNK